MVPTDELLAVLSEQLIEVHGVVEPAIRRAVLVLSGGDLLRIAPESADSSIAAEVGHALQAEKLIH